MRQVMRCVAWLACGGVAWAQPYQIQPGNVLDRNPQLGSAGINSTGRQYQINSSNRIVTGNVTGGAGFRGFSPISDPSSFGLVNGSALPSDRLFNFRRDTISAGDVHTLGPLPNARSPFYSTSSAVTNTGAIVSGLNRPGTSQVQSPYIPPRMDLRPTSPNPLSLANGAGALSVTPRVERLDSGQQVAGPVNERLLASPLFGAVRAVPVEALSAQAARDQGLGTNLVEPMDGRIQPQAPETDRIDQNRILTLGPNGVPVPRTDDMRAGADTDSGLRVATPPGGAAPARSGRVPAPLSNAAPRITSPTQAGDAYTGMRMMRGQLVQPLRTVPTIGEVAREQRTSSATIMHPVTPAGAAPSVPQAPPSALSAGQPTLQSGPLRTFVGSEQSALNRYLRQAETFIRAGQYYKAAGTYDIARSIDSRNPLPLLGRALALLGAGEYVSSASSLFQAINAYEDLALFPVDLPAFIPDIRVLDRRRADLERRLAAVEDYRLRFLLGYAEYCSSMQKLGLQDMRKAVAAAPSGNEVLQQFVDHLALASATRPSR